MAISVGTFARDGSLWCKADNDQRAWVESRTRIVKQLVRAGKAMGIKKGTMEEIGVELREGYALGEVRSEQAFTKLANELFKLLDRSTTVSGLLYNSFRRSERDSWWLPGFAKFRKDGPLRARRALVLSAQLMLPPAGSCPYPPEKSRKVERVLKLAKRYDSKWEISYNLACYYSWLASSPELSLSLQERNVDEALTWLETALEKPGSGQITCNWLNADPDLKMMRGTPRFTWILEQISERQPEQSPEPVGIGASPSMPARTHAPCPATSVA